MLYFRSNVVYGDFVVINASDEVGSIIHGGIIAMNSVMLEVARIEVMQIDREASHF